MKRPWMPLYIADYRSDTTRLSTLEHGAYLLLIMEYWRAESLPDDDRQLSRIAGLSMAQWKRMRPLIKSLFYDGWRHKRIDRELAHAVEVSEARSAAAAKRSNSTINSRNKQPSNGPSNDTTLHISQSELRSVPLDKVSRKRKGKTTLPEGYLLSEKLTEHAKNLGLSTREIEREFQKFRNNAAMNDRRCVDWDAAWRNWCLKALEYLGRDAPQKSNVTQITGFYAPFGSEQLDAWDTHNRATTGVGLPRDKSGGWHVASEWPPGHEKAA